MTMFIVNTITGFGTGTLDPIQAFIDLVVIADDAEVGVDALAGGMERVLYTQVQTGATQDRLNELVNTVFTPDYGAGAQNVDILLIAGPGTLAVTDGTSIILLADNGLALPPNNSGLPGAAFNPTNDSVAIYDTSINICMARAGSGGTLDLGAPSPVVLYHELSHCRRQVLNTSLALSNICNPACPAESDAIVDENVVRTAIAQRMAIPVVLRDSNIHCAGTCEADPGGCCIIASVVSGSATSPQVQGLRNVRDSFVRRSNVGFAFFERLFRGYYSFSPQFCTEIGRSPALGRAILDGYVKPLLEFWKLMVFRGFEDSRDDALGRQFASMHDDGDAAQATVSALERTEAYWDGRGPADDEDRQGLNPLLTLLRQRAWTSEHVRWALIQPVAIYRAILKSFTQGASVQSLGKMLSAAIDTWVPHFPLDPVWGALAGAQVTEELGTWGQRLLVTDKAKQIFSQRLRERFPDVTSISQTEPHKGETE